MKEKLILYNHFHNGDIFYSRILIEMLKDHFDIDYYHNMRAPLFSDLPQIKELHGVPSDFPQGTKDIKRKLINTWIGHDFDFHGNKKNFGCSYENYFTLSQDISEKLGISISNEKKYLPKIYFENLPDYQRISEVMLEHKKNYEKIILISDGPVHSGQAREFNFYPHVKKITELYPNYLFIITFHHFEEINNIINTDSITFKKPDLLEIGLISKFCDVVIGRASGPYCFTQNESNLLDETKTFLAFTNHQSEGKYYQEAKYKFLWSPSGNPEEIDRMIENSLKL